MLAVLDRSLPVVATSWMASEAPETPPGRDVALAPGVLIFRAAVLRASELADEELSAPPPPVKAFTAPAWHETASCRTVPEEQFFSEDRRVRVTLANQAKRMCKECPVAPRCLQHALEQREEFGIWAGTSGLQRKAMHQRIDDGHSSVDQELLTWFASR